MGGLPENWGPKFIKDCGQHVTIKPQGSMTFAMTSAFKDRVYGALLSLAANLLLATHDNLGF
jgi:hypothetical protein